MPQIVDVYKLSSAQVNRQLGSGSVSVIKLFQLRLRRKIKYKGTLGMDSASVTLIDMQTTSDLGYSVSEQTVSLSFTLSLSGSLINPVSFNEVLQNLLDFHANLKMQNSRLNFLWAA